MSTITEMTINEMLDLGETIAADLFEGKTYPWEVLPEIKDYIVKLGETLPKDRYEEVSEHVWVAKNAKVFPSAYLGAPCIIDEEAE
ncbi:MAG: UDP-N-acetylglucosamine pyrophosphorylase, partial [Lachnospiraceae bacterium]|nr:UDP-N-acetylglucosamine pyrophosphorylase [Lachnospiraceae bacterium]